VKYSQKERLGIIVWMMVLISLSVYTGCKLSMGGDSVADNEQDTGFARDIERVSIASAGSQANGDSEAPSISSNGRIVAFISDATNLVAGDTNGAQDVFVHDLDTGITERASVASAGTQANDDVFTLSLSANGRFVAFGSYATNLVAGDTNGVIDVFVRDRDTAATERVSVATAGTQANAESFSPAISSDGQFVAFQSDATNLVLIDTNNKIDIFVHNRLTGSTERVSVASDGTRPTATRSLRRSVPTAVLWHLLPKHQTWLPVIQTTEPIFFSTTAKMIRRNGSWGLPNLTRPAAPLSLPRRSVRMVAFWDFGQMPMIWYPVIPITVSTPLWSTATH
jgi:hypothetical protein